MKKKIYRSHEVSLVYRPYRWELETDRDSIRLSPVEIQDIANVCMEMLLDWEKLPKGVRLSKG